MPLAYILFFAFKLLECIANSVQFYLAILAFFRQNDYIEPSSVARLESLSFTLSRALCARPCALSPPLSSCQTFSAVLVTQHSSMPSLICYEVTSD